MIGQRISHYRITEKISAGGMGVVYRAYDERLDRTVAIKVLSRGLLEGEGAQKRFRQEAMALARINHPNIATLYDVGCDDGTDFLVMEDIQGVTLEGRIMGGPLPIGEATSLTVQICEGLAAAHERGIIHRDLKPGNMCLTSDGRLKILDFGLAERATGPSPTGATATATTVQETSGTIPYMAPEQLRGQTADVRSDLWAVGVVLYELICSRRPFPGTVPTAIAADIIYEQPAPPRFLRPEVPVNLERIILKCLEKDPSRRYVSARAMLQDLKELGASLTLPQPPLAPTSPSEALSMEIAHVLFMDIVSYSTMPMDEQEHVLRELQAKVRSNREFVAAQMEDRLIRLPTGDGMALVFFEDAEAPVRCALELAPNLGGLKLRMGINSGPVYRVADINANHNVAGAGINMAQRVMDCGDAGHILVSKPVADVLGQVNRWKAALHDLGEAEVKHGVRIHIFNLYKDGAGNPEIPKKLRRVITRRHASVAGVTALIGLAIGAWLLVHFGRIGAGKSNARRSVAILGFHNLGKPEDAYISTFLSERLSTEVGAGESLRVVSGENVSRARTDLSLSDQESLSPGTLAQVHKLLGSDLVVLGSYIATNGKIRLDIRVQNALSGETIAVLSRTENSLLDLATNAGQDLRAKCGAAEITPAEARTVEASQPKDPRALRLYAEGLAKLRLSDAMAARDSLERTIAADPNFAPAHAALSQAWSELGYDVKAKSEAQQAFKLSGGLPRKDALINEGRYRESNREWERAITIYRSLWTFYPDELDFGLQVAETQIRAGKAQDALTTASVLRKMPPPTGDDPRIDLKEAAAYEALSDFVSAQRIAEQAVEKGKRIGARLLTSQAELIQCWNFKNLGDLVNATNAGRQAQEEFTKVGDKRGMAKSLTCIGDALQDQGNPTQALDMHQQALKFVQAIGDQLNVAGALINIANIKANQADLDGSNHDYKHALDVAREIGDKPDTLLAQNNIGLNLMMAGDLGSAQKMFQSSLETARNIGDDGGLVEALTNISTVLYLKGDLVQAQENIQESLKKARQVAMPAYLADSLVAEGDILMARDDLKGAEKSYQESLEICSQSGEKQSMANTRLALATLLLENGHLDQAAEYAAQAKADFQAQKDINKEAASRNIVARTDLSQKKIAEAASEIAEAKKLPLQDEGIRLSVEITSGRVLIASGRLKDAISELRATLARVADKKLGGLELETRLAQSEAQVSSGDLERARSNLQSLQKDSNAKGFLLIARHASALLAPYQRN